MKSTTLTVKTKVVPPPSKAELVTAMAQIRLEQLRQQRAAILDEREALRESIQEELENLFAAKGAGLPSKSVDVGERKFSSTGKIKEVTGVRITFDLTPVLTSSIRDRILKYSDLPSYIPEPNFKDVRTSILVKVNQETPLDMRIKTLVTENKPEITAMLDALFRDPKAKSLPAPSVS